ncbi:MAG: hypothetical protein PWQ79_555 [Thermococcaceae archaeon]|nr:hypothetical protein [Thermococcaceae archaeon]MDK2913640.1 hypothetical protein [Thermococcaceae archaeon]
MVVSIESHSEGGARFKRVSCAIFGCMGVYRAAAIPIIVLFFTAGLVGHNTGRLRELPVVGPPWDDLMSSTIEGVYALTGFYLGTVGVVDSAVSETMPLNARDEYIYRVQNSSYVYPYWSYTAFPREKLPEILKSKVVQDFLDSVIEEAESRLSGKKIPKDEYVLYLRATAYEVMVERHKYCAGGPTKDPRYVVTRCGDCDDWHVVAYALISKINERYGIDARYDWFPPIGRLYKGEYSSDIGSDYIELNGHCPMLLDSKNDCVVKIRRFKKYSSLSAFYARNGEGGIVYLFEFPELRYVSIDDILKEEGNPAVKYLNGA